MIKVARQRGKNSSSITLRSALCFIRCVPLSFFTTPYFYYIPWKHLIIRNWFGAFMQRLQIYIPEFLFDSWDGRFLFSLLKLHNGWNVLLFYGLATTYERIISSVIQLNQKKIKELFKLISRWNFSCNFIFNIMFIN